MSKRTASNSWGFSAETVGRFSDAMKEARDQAPKAERWKLAKIKVTLRWRAGHS